MDCPFRPAVTYRVLLLFAPFLFGGCIPLYPTVREARSGTVLDAASGRPVAGAKVRVESFRVPTPPSGGWGVEMVHAIEVKTDASGHWSVPSEHDWTMGILAADGLPLFADAYCVLADGFQKEVRSPHENWLGLNRGKVAPYAVETDAPAELRLVRSTNTSPPPEPAGSATTCGVPLEDR
jgi:hypothetical protein